MATDTQSGFSVLSATDADLRGRDYKRLRPHKKTRAGCLPCKEKKVKVSVVSRSPLAELRGLYDTSVTSADRSANDVKEISAHAYTATIPTADMITVILTSAPFRTSAHSLRLRLLTPVQDTGPLVFSS